MKTASKHWADTIIALLTMLNFLLLMHMLKGGFVAEQSAQILALLLFYGWLAQWIKRP